MKLRVRAAQRGDGQTVLSFIRALADYEKLSHEVEARLPDIERDLFGPHPRVFAEIAEIDGEPAGFVLWYYTYSTFRGRHGIWMEDLFVLPRFRGKGAGKALMADLARRCRDENLARLEWWVLDWNQPSIDFYHSLGAQMMDEWRVCRLDGASLGVLAGTGGANTPMPPEHG